MDKRVVLIAFDSDSGLSSVSMTAAIIMTSYDFVANSGVRRGVWPLVQEGGVAAGAGQVPREGSLQFS